MNTQIISNLDHICRTCITESDELVSLFHYTDEDFTPSVADILQYHAGIQISLDDGLPPNLCLACLSFLSECVKFLNKCKYSDKLLRNVNETLKTNNSEEILENDSCENTDIKPSNIIKEDVKYELLDLAKCNEQNLIEEVVLNVNVDETNIEPISLNENTSNNQNFVWLEFQNNINGGTNNVIVEENDVIQYPAANQDVDEMIVTAYYDDLNLENKSSEDVTALDLNISSNLLLSKENQHNDSETNVTVENCDKLFEPEVVCDETNIIVVSAEENIEGCEVFKIYSSDYKTYHGRYFYVGNGQIPAKCKRRNYAYYERVSDDTSAQIDDKEDLENPGCVKIYNCKFCVKHFGTKSMLLRHLRTHTGEKPYLCADCGKQFATMSGLDLHQRRHSGEKRYQCCHCGMKFVDNSNLRKHIQCHTGEKPFYCDQCGRNFARKFLLELHMRTHTGEKPYQCEVCNRCFRQLGDLSAHRRIHSGERPHKCSMCGKGFIKSSSLQIHLKSHLRNQC